MFLVCVSALGMSLGRYLLWPSLPVFASILAIALGIEGALQGRSLYAVAVMTLLMLAILEGAFVAGAFTRGLGLRNRLYPKI